MEYLETTDLGIAVITGAWDDLPALFSRLGYTYAHLGSALSALQDEAVLQGRKALYVACGADCEMPGPAAQNIREFVARGGGLYVSDMAAPVIEQLFPGMVTFSKLDYRSDSFVRVVDPALAAQLGSTISLHMDYQNSEGIQWAAPGVQVLIRGTRQDFDDQEYPYLVTFQHGQGQVLYSVFHNASQVNETEERLLRFLVLRPLLSGALAQARLALSARPGSAVMETIAAAVPGEPPETITLKLARPGRPRLVVAWEGRASFSAGVTGPDGRLVRYFSTDQCPLVLDFTAPKAGEYTCEVKGIQLPGPNTPFAVLTAA